MSDLRWGVLPRQARTLIFFFGVLDKSRPGKLKKYISPDYHKIMVTVIYRNYNSFLVEEEFEFIVVVVMK